MPRQVPRLDVPNHAKTKRRGARSAINPTLRSRRRSRVGYSVSLGGWVIGTKTSWRGQQIALIEAMTPCHSLSSTARIECVRLRGDKPRRTRMRALMQRAVHERAHNDQECHFPPPLLSEGCRRPSARRNLRGRDRGRGDSSFIVSRLSPPIHNDDFVYAIRRRCCAASGHDRSSGPRSGSGARPRLQGLTSLLRPRRGRLVCAFYWQCSGRNDRSLSVNNFRLFAVIGPSLIV